MKTFFNQKAWLYGLSLAVVASSSTTSIFAQDSNTSTDHKVPSIQKITNEDLQAVEKNHSTLINQDYSFNWGLNQTQKIEAPKKAELGVLFKGNESGLVILKTFPNTTASAIGLQENDRIISLNGQTAEHIAGFVKIIQEHKVGDAIVLKYERDGVSKTATSTLNPTAKHHYLTSRRSHNNYHASNLTTEQRENACEELEKIYNKPFLGVYLSNPHLESGDGARLTSIIEGTGAEAAVLQAADKITKMDKNPISCSQAAMKFIQSKNPGDKITIQVVRENKTMLIKATLGSFADSPYASSKIKTLGKYCEANKQKEIDLQENACEKLEEIYGKPFLGVYFKDRYAESGNGAQLTSVIEGTGAANASLQAADKITKMDQTPISCSKEAVKFIQSKQPGDLIKVQMLREGKNVLVDVTLGSWATYPGSFANVSKLQAYCDANTSDENEEEEVVSNEDEPVVLMPTFETQAVMEVFPNPTADFVNIRFEGKKAPLSINIISLNGQTVYTKNIQNFDGNYSDQLDLSKYPSGVYLINLNQDGQQMTQQVVVE